MAIAPLLIPLMFLGATSFSMQSYGGSSIREKSKMTYQSYLEKQAIKKGKMKQPNDEEVDPATEKDKAYGKGLYYKVINKLTINVIDFWK